jgi:GT2 family glycosyltransferase
VTAPATHGPLVGIVVPTWNRAADAANCLSSVAGLTYRRRRVFVVDNGSVPAERAALRAALAGDAEGGAALIELPENRGFAAAVNAGLAAAFDAGCGAALVLNDDAEVEPDLLDLLLAGIGVDPAAGVVAPCVHDAASGREVSRGERVSVPLVCWPRTWLRVRRAATTPYRVSGVLGVAFLLTRACWAEVGGLAEPFFAYYEEVDYWLRVRAAGFAIVVVPAARVRHRGFRGFKGGFTPLAAYLKARNLPLLVRRNGSALDWAAFLPAYLVLLAASAAGYAWRAHGGDVVAAMLRGARDAWHAAAGPPPAALVPPTA